MLKYNILSLFSDDTDFSESEGLSSAQINKRMSDHIRSPTSVTSETEEESRDGW